ncbi:aminoglycoside phosphotransferase family protein [Planctomyces sp. SH-PL62]|uniref:phosphotransferase n=1 Tax=Planctomyces sp. SH-PL62 TaxID=1636152 RepID=UPI00078BCF0B|nr:aminoglycoside phosphotransferase family protein [Planctomyces sp. SH-PL62]AMV39596.1 Phosphotransferase enzyme family protein [Planctomyces sp. SH-PL62]
MTPLGLVDLFDRYPPSERPLESPTALSAAGGLSGSLLWRYRSTNGDRLARAWPPTTGLDRVERIHAWLRLLADLPFVPRPIHMLLGETAVSLRGCCWEVVPWLPGAAVAGSLPTAARVRAAFGALAEVHVRIARVDARHGESPGLAVRRDELDRLARGGFEAIARALEARSDDSLAGPASTWLELARRVAPVVLASTWKASRAALPLQPCLRDARPEHFLFVGDALTGLVDYGAMDVESVAADLARLWGEWLPGGEGEALRAEGLAEYRRIRPVGAAELEAAVAFEELADVLIAERWIRWRYLEGRRFDDERAFDDGIARGLSRLRGLAGRRGLGA